MNGGEQIDFSERQIAATDPEDETLRRTQGDPGGWIDTLVNELYGLTQERFGSLKMERNGEQEYELPKIPQRPSTCDFPTGRLSDSHL